MSKRATALVLVCAAIYGSHGARATEPVAATEAIQPDDARCAETARNRKVMAAFADLFYRQQDIEQAMMTYVVPDYIQHSPRVPDGRAAMLEMAKHFQHSNAKLEVKRIMVDGDMAVVHVRGQIDPKMPAEAVVDIFRLKDGKIVEHWDVAQPIPPTSANGNSML